MFFSHVTRNPEVGHLRLVWWLLDFISNLPSIFLLPHSSHAPNYLMITRWLLQLQSLHLNSSRHGGGKGNGEEGMLSIWINLFQTALMEALPSFAYISSTIAKCKKSEKCRFLLQLPITQKFCQWGRKENERLRRQTSQLGTTGDAEIKTQLCIQVAQASGRIISFQTG